MMIKWLNAIVGGRAREQRTEAQEPVHLKQALASARQAQLIDVPHRVLTEEAARRRAELEGLVKHGWPIVKREKVKKSVRKKVWEIVSSAFQPDDEMVEEITERIVDAAEVDPTFERLFKTDQAEKN